VTGPADPAYKWEFRCEDFVYARLAEQQTLADQMPPGPARDQALNHIDTLYLIASQHNIWVSMRGQSAGRCITCSPADGGVPCHTIRGLARLWRTHPDYRPGWNDHVDRPESCSGSTYREYKQRSTIFSRRETELNAFHDRFDLRKTSTGGEYWQCRTCGAHGEEQRPIPGAFDYPYAITDAPAQHPTCPERNTA
jgi:hypothetical protein